MSTRTEEPALNVGAITSAASALLVLVVAFWPGLLSEDQKVAILGVVTVAAPMIVAAVTRAKVTPNGSVAERVDGDHVIAGEANDRATEGSVVREVDVPRRSIGDSSD